MPGNVLLLNGRILRRDGTIQGPCDILVESGVIKSVTPSVPSASGATSGVTPGTIIGVIPGATSGITPGVTLLQNDPGIGTQAHARTIEAVDCQGCLVSPGLVNLHTHSPMAIFRGIAEDVNVEDWFNVRIWPFESSLTPEDIRIGSMLAISEMLDCGVTAFFDHYFLSEEIAGVAMEAGMRADIAPTIFGMGPRWQESLDEASLLIERANQGAYGNRVRMRMGPHAPYTCTQDVLEACAKRAGELGVGVHIHVSETEKQVHDSIAQYGKTPFERLHEAGLLDIPCIIAHGIWILEQELELLGPDLVFAVAPKTYLKLASGFGNLYRFQLSGGPASGMLQVGIGTDGAASSNTLNPLEQARLYGLLAKNYLADATVYGLKMVWNMLMEGHSALGQNTGDIASGFEADLVVWDFRTPHTWPVYDPLAALIYSAGAGNVRDVLIGGEFKKKAGKVRVFEDTCVFDEAERVKSRLLARGAGRARVKY
ncbi:MAG TPA: amidohydrolase family protein [Firmicutes bacterium]|nr:amidohydrolase family protein [Candidatus Fermentithermobacillaceae bacterium]